MQSSNTFSAIIMFYWRSIVMYVHGRSSLWIWSHCRWSKCIQPKGICENTLYKILLDGKQSMSISLPNWRNRTCQKWLWNIDFKSSSVSFPKSSGEVTDCPAIGNLEVQYVTGKIISYQKIISRGRAESGNKKVDNNNFQRKLSRQL